MVINLTQNGFYINISSKRGQNIVQTDIEEIF